MSIGMRNATGSMNSLLLAAVLIVAIFVSQQPVVSGAAGRRKVTKLQLYVEDVLSGRSPSNVMVAKANTSLSSPTLFGAVVVLDDPVRMSPDTSAGIVGRSQGHYAFVSLEDRVIHLSSDLVFSSGIYNGSSITIVGNNPFERPHRELPVVGGTGEFRFVRGFVNISTVYIRTDSALFKYDLTLFLQ